MFRPSPRSLKKSAPKHQWCQKKSKYTSLSREEEQALLAGYVSARDQLRELVEVNPLTIHFLEQAFCAESTPSGEITGIFKTVENNTTPQSEKPFCEAYEQHRDKLLKLKTKFAKYNLKDDRGVSGNRKVPQGQLKVQNSIATTLRKLELTNEAVLSIGYSVLDVVKTLEQLELRSPVDKAAFESLDRVESELGVNAGFLRDTAQEVKSQLHTLNQISEGVIEHCLPMVIRISSNYHRHDFQMDDLIQEGLFGVLISLDRFDLDRGVRFKTYANYWVRQSVGRAVLDRGRKIRVPRHAMAMYSRVIKTRMYLQENNDEVTPEDISNALRVPLNSVNGALNLVQQPLSLDGSLAGGGSIGDYLQDEAAFSPEEETMFHILSDELKTVLSRLPAREEKILRMRYGIGAAKQYTLRELGEVMGISRERVRQLEQQALGRIRSSQSIGQLREFLGPLPSDSTGPCEGGELSRD